MSRLRTGHKPDDWRDEEPREAHLGHRPYAHVPAFPVGSMMPLVTGTVLSMPRPTVVREPGWQVEARKRNRLTLRPGSRT